MDHQKQATVIRYLHVHYPGREIEVREDFDHDAEAFKVHLDGGVTRLLKVSSQLIDDTPEDALAHLLDRMEVCELLERGKGQGVFVTSVGPKYFDRG
jgi:hypothetical protein